MMLSSLLTKHLLGLARLPRRAGLCATSPLSSHQVPRHKSVVQAPGLLAAFYMCSYSESEGKVAETSVRVGPVLLHSSALLAHLTSIRASQPPTRQT